MCKCEQFGGFSCNSCPCESDKLTTPPKFAKSNCSIRGQQWQEFANAVSEHIEQYTVPQYGDAGNDLCTDYTVEHCVAQMKKYLARQGKNSRPGQDQLDLVKIAHYAQMAWTLPRGK